MSTHLRLPLWAGALVLIVLVTVNPALAQVTAIDLGTLGGSSSFPFAMNDKGQVVGESETVTNGPTHAFLWTPNTGMIDLGTLGGTRSNALGVNNAGEVVGYSDIPGDTTVHAFLWTSDGGMIDLGTLGGAGSIANDINERGQIVGFSQIADGTGHAFLWTPSAGMIDLGTFGNGSMAVALNDAGEVVGYSNAVRFGPSQAFLWTARDGMVALGTLGGGSCAVLSVPSDITNSGHVVGSACTAASAVSPVNHAFAWTQHSGMVDLGTLGDGSDMERPPSSGALDVSESGHIVGVSDVPGAGFIRHAFIWSSLSGMIDIGTLGGGGSEALAVNNRGQVVGHAALTGNTTAHAFSWTARGGMVDLAPLPAYSSSVASHVNDSGLVVGTSRHFPETRATLWILNGTRVSEK